MSATTTRSRERALEELRVSFKGAMAAIRRLRGRDTHRSDGCSFAQYQVLFDLAEHDELSSGELAQHTELSPAATTQLLDTLVAKGFVERNRSEQDRRVVTCRLTVRGRELVGSRRQEMEGKWRAALDEFSAKEIVIAATVIDRLRRIFDELNDETRR